MSNRGEVVTKQCYAIFTDPADDVKTAVSLDESGWVFSTTKPGSTFLGRVTCTLGGFFKYNSTFATRAIRFDLPGSGRIAYFGHVRVDMNDGGGAQITGAIIGGAIGALVASTASPSKGQLAVANDLPGAVREYRRRYGRAADALKVVDEAGGPPPPAVAPVPRSTNPNLLVQGADLGGGLQLVWLGLPRTDANRVGLRFLRDAPQAELAGCKQLGLVIDGVRTDHALAYKATRGPLGLREAAQAETDLATVKAMIAAKRVQLDLCGLGRKLPRHAVSAAHRFVAGFEQHIQRPAPSPEQLAPEPAADPQAGSGTDAGMQSDAATPMRADAEAL